MSEFIRLCLEFAKIGILAVGGGMATIPFLSELTVKYPQWLSMPMLMDMIAVSESTPGPIGINMATYVGYMVAGVPGAILASVSMILPALIIVVLVSRVLDKYRKNYWVESVFHMLRPAVTGLIAAAGYSVISVALFKSGSALSFPLNADLVAVAVFTLLLIAQESKKLKSLHPVLYILLGAVAGLAMGYLGL